MTPIVMPEHDKSFDAATGDLTDDQVGGKLANFVASFKG